MIKIDRKLKGKELTYDEYEVIIDGELWEEVESCIADQGRWNTLFYTVYKNIEDGQLVIIAKSEGSTESQYNEYRSDPAILYKA